MKFKSVISTVLVLVIMLNCCPFAFAVESKISADALVLTEENGDVYYFVMEDTETTRTSILYDADGNVALTLVVDKEAGIMYNPANRTSISVPKSAVTPLTPCSVMRAGDKDYEYEFCKLGQSYKTTDTIMVSDILAAVGVTAQTVAITAFLLSWTGLGQVSSSVASTIGDIAGDVRNYILKNDLDHEVRYTSLHTCTELYESDWSYPNGGFWFLGYTVSFYSMNLV